MICVKIIVNLLLAMLSVLMKSLKNTNIFSHNIGKAENNQLVQYITHCVFLRCFKKPKWSLKIVQ